MIKTKRIFRLLIGSFMTAALATAFVLVGAPAQAANPCKYDDRVAGCGKYSQGNGWKLDGDWRDNVKLDSTSSPSNLVMLWQGILFSEGLVEKSDITGTFDEVTENATRAWQNLAGANETGAVDRKTWSRADDQLYFNGKGSGSIGCSSGIGISYKPINEASVNVFELNRHRSDDNCSAQGPYYLYLIHTGNETNPIVEFEGDTTIWFHELTVTVS